MQQASQPKHAKTLIYCTQYNIPPHLSLLPTSGFRLNFFLAISHRGTEVTERNKTYNL